MKATPHHLKQMKFIHVMASSTLLLMLSPALAQSQDKSIIANPKAVANQLKTHQDPTQRFVKPHDESPPPGLHAQPMLTPQIIQDGDEVKVTTHQTLRLSYGEAPHLYMEMGRKVRPFAATASHWDSMSLTGEMATLPAQGLALGLRADEGLYGGLYAGTPHSRLSLPNSYTAHMGYMLNEGAFSMDVGVRYTNNMQLQRADDLLDLQGVSAHGIFNMGALTMLGEYVTTANRVSDQTSHLTGLRPSAWNTELGYRHAWGGIATTFALGYQGSGVPLDGDLPEDRFLAGVRMNLFPNSALSLELRRDRMPDQLSGDAATFKFAVDF
ncbi:LbtU family siderophore porin [Magnetococcus sp. PR-3]|uniref:LbtU family siderophore porin n=1 Tax=Magnetococcus sp. PR-3 TaxID=3120355 RepID=UPI002FCE4F6F